MHTVTRINGKLPRNGSPASREAGKTSKYKGCLACPRAEQDLARLGVGERTTEQAEVLETAQCNSVLLDSPGQSQERSWSQTTTLYTHSKPLNRLQRATDGSDLSSRNITFWMDSQRAEQRQGDQ